MATVVRRAPYKDFLQPALQRRFASTAGVVLGLAYIESLTLSSWNSCTCPLLLLLTASVIFCISITEANL